ncbi:hypothetical protein vseg_004491 [Gypsophila vaccaria]
MELIIHTLTIVFLTIICTILFIYNLCRKVSNTKLPPGPKPWPIIGNIHQLSDRPHQSLAKLSKIYGPIMSLKLGSITTIVISSPEIAKEMFSRHDLVVSGRHIPCTGRVGDHDKFSMVWQSVGPKWRELRKIVTVHLFTSQRLDAGQTLRQEKVNQLVKYVQQCCDNCLAVDIGKAGFTASLNLLSNTFFSIDLTSHESSYSQEFKDLVSDFLEKMARPNLSDIFPILKPFDLQGIIKNFTCHFYKLTGVIEEIIDDRLNDETSFKDDVLSTLLKLAKVEEVSLNDIKHLFMDLFLAGTETSSSTLEWAMTELLRNPNKMSKAQKEIDQVIGPNRPVQESDISYLPYIQSIIKETLRLHPPVPLLAPRKAETDVQLCGYRVPKNSQIFVNVWCYSRDPTIWRNPLEFEPERFLGRDIDVKGRDFELIPFGAGRRFCPGYPLAFRMNHLLLATIIHSFDWKPSDGLCPLDIDVEETFAFSLHKSRPLLALPLPRRLSTRD